MIVGGCVSRVGEGLHSIVMNPESSVLILESLHLLLQDGSRNPRGQPPLAHHLAVGSGKHGMPMAVRDDNPANTCIVGVQGCRVAGLWPHEGPPGMIG